MTGKLRIAFVDYVLEPDRPARSGLSDIVWDMASELAAQGHEPHVVASYHSDSFPDDRVVVHNFRTPPIGYRNVIGHAWLLKRAARIVRDLGPDIVHAPEYVSTALLPLFGVKQPLVLTVPGNIYHRVKYGNGYEWYYTQVLKWAATASAKRCTAVIATSREMKRWWEMTGSDPRRTPLIPLGVDASRFSAVAGARTMLRLEEGRPQLLYVGRLSIEKGVLDLLSALSGVGDQLREHGATVTMIGKGPLEGEIAKRIETENLADIVQLLPWEPQDRLKLWYSAADLLLLPSKTEPLGRVMLEAMSCGTPVIATAAEGPTDHVRDGVNGLLVPLGDPAAFAERLLAALENPAALNSMGERAAAYAARTFGWEAIVKRVIFEVYLPAVNH